MFNIIICTPQNASNDITRYGNINTARHGMISDIKYSQMYLSQKMATRHISFVWLGHNLEAKIAQKVFSQTILIYMLNLLKTDYICTFQYIFLFLLNIVL